MAANVGHEGTNDAGTLLALTPGLRETGWAVLAACGDTERTTGQCGVYIVVSGVVGLKGRRKAEPSARIAHQLDSLSAVAVRWGTVCAVRSRAGSINWRVPGLEQLDDDLRRWADGLGIPLFDYTTQEVRAAVAGQSNASKDSQCYAIMRRMGLIGQSRATAEWEAIAVGYYHLALRK